MSAETTHPAEQAPKYAECTTCGIDLQTPTERDQHIEATWAPIPEDDPHFVAGQNRRRAHGYRVVNPTPEERLQFHVDLAVDWALDRFCDHMETDVHRGRYTKEDITRALRSHPDFEEAWENYWQNDLAED